MLKLTFLLIPIIYSGIFKAEEPKDNCTIDSIGSQVSIVYQGVKREAVCLEILDGDPAWALMSTTKPVYINNARVGLFINKNLEFSKSIVTDLKEMAASMGKQTQ